MRRLRGASRPYRFAERLTSQSELDVVSRNILEGICAAIDADVGTLYVVRQDDTDSFVLAAALGLEPGKLPAAVALGYGLAGRALDERRAIDGDLGPADLRVSVLGDAVVLRWELHVPLLQGGTRLGVLTLGRLRDAPFDEVDRELIAHLVEQTTVVLGNALSAARAARVSSLNQTLIDSTLDAIRLIDLEGRVVIENERMKVLARGVTGSGDSSSNWAQAARVDELTTNPAAYRAQIAEIRANPDGPTDHEFEFEGSGRIFRRFTSPVRDETGLQIGRVVILRELTAERQVERLKNEFVATITQELRTPLTSIAGFVEVLLDEEAGELNAQQRHFLGIVKRGSDRLRRLVDDLLFVAHVDAAQLELSVGAVQLDPLVSDAIEAATPAAADQEVSLSFSPGAVPPFIADGQRLAQLLDNLVANAIKFTPPEGRVSLTTAWHDGEAVLTVADSGIGIPDAEKEQLFECFFRASTATDEAIPGTGLGLAISNAIVQAHGGAIEVTDTRGGGTTFTIRLPLTPASMSAAA